MDLGVRVGHHRSRTSSDRLRDIPVGSVLDRFVLRCPDDEGDFCTLMRPTFVFAVGLSCDDSVLCVALSPGTLPPAADVLHRRLGERLPSAQQVSPSAHAAPLPLMFVLPWNRCRPAKLEGNAGDGTLGSDAIYLCSEAAMECHRNSFCA